MFITTCTIKRFERGRPYQTILHYYLVLLDNLHEKHAQSGNINSHHLLYGKNKVYKLMSGLIISQILILHLHKHLAIMVLILSRIWIIWTYIIDFRPKLACIELLLKLSLVDNQIKFVMNQKRQNILNIQYTLQNSLLFKWDLRGLLNQQTYIRHLFIFNFEHQSFLQKAVNLIYSSVKIGDMFAFLTRMNIFLDQSLDWSEKTSLGSGSLRFKEFSKYSTQELTLGLEIVGKETKQYNTPLMVNIFIDQLDQIPQLKSRIQQLRKKGYYSFHVNFFANFPSHDISTSTGFNYINTTEESLQQASKIYKRLALESAVTNIRVEIYCPTIQLSTRKDNIWESVDFGRVRRYLYGPSIHYKQDNVSFCRETTRLGSALTMSVLLRITLLSGKVLNSEKTLTINEENVRIYTMTRCEHREPRSTYQFSRNIRSKTQPFCSSSQIIMIKVWDSEDSQQRLWAEE